MIQVNFTAVALEVHSPPETKGESKRFLGTAKRVDGILVCYGPTGAVLGHALNQKSARSIFQRANAPKDNTAS